MQKIRLAMIGGGEGALIGNVHRIAARMDNEFELVAGDFSSDPERNLRSANALGVSDDRVYDTVEALIKGEKARPDGAEAVAIVTPNHLHFDAVKACLQAGFHVICDKPVTSALEDAVALVDIVRNAPGMFFLTHNYTGNAMVRQMRDMVLSGELGEIRFVNCEYVQDWLSEPVELQGSKAAEWRTDPQKAGAGGAIGDIGTHAYNLASYVTGLTPDKLCADLTSFIKGRRLDDNASILLRYDNGAKGQFWISQVAIGNENRLNCRIFGTKGSLEWSQEDPNRLWYCKSGQPRAMLTRAGNGATHGNTQSGRVPPGHPEGFLEAFGNIYKSAANAIRSHQQRKSDPSNIAYPTIEDGLNGLYFIDACIRSNEAANGWVDVETCARESA
ncbi:Gfo/Idh/MocA family protein [Ochrobactrum sp. EDr1-4]|jgi:predicted dehydrogenase|uniref:Gfo/Idh/MocA family protein n=1 Tax=Ochrobactrum sp. EDr1-4 TaxID=3368622 RepID=UPI003B9E42D0